MESKLRAGAEVELTEQMIEAGCAVEWVSDYQGEFEGFDPEHDAVMRKNVSELWAVMVSARPKNWSSYPAYPRMLKITFATILSRKP